MDAATAEEVNKIFFEVIIAPDYSEEALNILFSKKNRIVLRLKKMPENAMTFRSILNGALVQERDAKVETPEDLNCVTTASIPAEKIEDLHFANKNVKHSKSNAIVLAKGRMLLASGVGQTSRVDALKHAIEKANSFELSLEDAVMASDAFFPFADCVEIAYNAGIRTVIQPGGSIRDNETVDFCNKNGIAMAITGFSHFKH